MLYLNKFIANNISSKIISVFRLFIAGYGALYHYLMFRTKNCKSFFKTLTWVPRRRISPLISELLLQAEQKASSWLKSWKTRKKEKNLCFCSKTKKYSKNTILFLSKTRRVKAFFYALDHGGSVVTTMANKDQWRQSPPCFLLQLLGRKH